MAQQKNDQPKEVSAQDKTNAGEVSRPLRSVHETLLESVDDSKLDQVKESLKNAPLDPTVVNEVLFKLEESIRQETNQPISKATNSNAE